MCWVSEASCQGEALTLVHLGHIRKPMPYLHNWRWPQKGEEAPGGQPTDQAPIDESSAKSMGPIMSMLKKLVTPAWH